VGKTIEDAKDWLPVFQETMKNYNYGDAPRTISLDKGHSIMLAKVDDGIYSGFIKRSIDRDGESELEENISKVTQKSLPDIIQYLKAREYIMPESYEDSVDRAEMEVEMEQPLDVGNDLMNSEMASEVYDSATMEMSEESNKINYKIKMLELLDKLLN
jgi:hypothetical protein